jgi:predicted methyltransferase
MEYDTPVLGADPETASFDIAARLPLDTWEQQQLLENTDPVSRLRQVVAFLGRELALLRGVGLVGTPLRSAGDRFTLN